MRGLQLRHFVSIAVLVANSVVVCISSTASSQTIVRSFDGDKGPDQEHCRPQEIRCGRQAEMVAAANGKQVVQVTWQHVNVYDYRGKLLQSTSLPEFIHKAG